MRTSTPESVSVKAKEAWLRFFLTRIVGLLIDTVALGAAYFCAFLLRFDFHAPSWGWRSVALSFMTVAVIELVMLIASGTYRIPWRRMGLKDIPRFVFAMSLACVVLSFARFGLNDVGFSHIRPPYSVTLISFVLSSIAVVSWRVVWAWSSLTLIKDKDLLEREVSTMNSAVAVEFLRGKTVMITGAGGSIGSELVRQVALACPKLMLLVERSENALYEIDREMRQIGCVVPMKPLMVDINDESRMRDIFSFYRPDVVLHAAAYKHVPMVELNPKEGERNNTFATKRLAEMSLEFNVKRFVLISTDKAVNPVSVMGKTKLKAEQAIMALDGPFCAVRFGNVLGSSGSVVPLFKEQIQKRRPITVTHPDMKRYFMTVSEAVGLVLQAASRKEKAIYTLDMGKPVRILDLAEELIKQAGLKPYVDIPIVFTGIRPGEKLFEELDISEKSVFKTDMARIYINKMS